MEKMDKKYTNPAPLLDNRFPQPISPFRTIQKEVDEQTGREKQDQLDRIEAKLDQLLGSEYHLINGIWQ